MRQDWPALLLGIILAVLSTASLSYELWRRLRPRRHRELDWWLLAMPAAICPHCHKLVPVMRDGTLGQHNNKRGTLCVGSGAKPQP